MPRWEIFCNVIDNYGDIGVCWRFARQLAAEYSFCVRLWVDDLVSFQKFCRALDPSLLRQSLCGVDIYLWREDVVRQRLADPLPDVVVEAFACQLPLSYIHGMANAARQPVWINLEYLSAEQWVSGCHGLPSPHPRHPLVKSFFFPGFTSATGGLLAERDLLAQRCAFGESAAARHAFWASLGLQMPSADEVRISLFSYENSNVNELLDAWSNAKHPVLCLIPEASGVLKEVTEERLLGRGSLSVHVLPFLQQDVYDQLLWACDCNFVRGEDSFVRAQWAARPFVWHIYPQPEEAHWPKLMAFLDAYCADLPMEAALIYRRFCMAWNQQSGLGEAWDHFWTYFSNNKEVFSQHADRWSELVLQHGNLASNLVKFCHSQLK